MRRDGKMVEEIADLAGLSRTQPALALALAIFMFSLAGIPPLAGFFAKFYIFLAAIDARLLRPRRDRRAGERGGRLLLPAHRQDDVFRRARAAPSTSRWAPVLGTVLTVAALLTCLFFVFPAPLGGQRRRRGRDPVHGMTAPRSAGAPAAARATTALGSTNDEAKRWRARAPPHGPWSGRAPRPPATAAAGGVWASPPGNLYLASSCVPRPRRRRRRSWASPRRWPWATRWRRASPGRSVSATNGRTTCWSTAARSPASCWNPPPGGTASTGWWSASASISRAIPTGPRRPRPRWRRSEPTPRSRRCWRRCCRRSTPGSAAGEREGFAPLRAGLARARRGAGARDRRPARARELHRPLRRSRPRRRAAAGDRGGPAPHRRRRGLSGGGLV